MKTHSQLSEIKRSPEPLIINTALALIGSLPTWLGKLIAPLTADAASVSFSNMMGPTEKVYWPVTPGAATHDYGVIESIFFATSPPFHYGPLVSILSYDGIFFSTISARADMFSHEELIKILNIYLPAAIDTLVT